ESPFTRCCLARRVRALLSTSSAPRAVSDMRPTARVNVSRRPPPWKRALLRPAPDIDRPLAETLVVHLRPLLLQVRCLTSALRLKLRPAGSPIDSEAMPGPALAPDARSLSVGLPLASPLSEPEAVALLPLTVFEQFTFVTGPVTFTGGFPSCGTNVA